MTFDEQTSLYLACTKDLLGQPATEDPAYVCDPWEMVINQGMKALFVKPPSSNALWGKEGPTVELFYVRRALAFNQG